MDIYLRCNEIPSRHLRYNTDKNETKYEVTVTFVHQNLIVCEWTAVSNLNKLHLPDISVHKYWLKVRLVWPWPLTFRQLSVSLWSCVNKKQEVCAHELLLITVDFCSFQQFCRMESEVLLIQKPSLELKEKISELNVPFFSVEGLIISVKKNVEVKTFLHKQMRNQLQQEDTALNLETGLCMWTSHSWSGQTQDSTPVVWM